jgi:NDP-sugar pyrophosphorylase family protein
MTEIQIVIPMAGLGTRFINAGYKTPKPFIEVLGEPMINMIIKNFKSYNHKIKFFLIALKEHSSKIDNTNNLYTIIEVDNITEGQACSVLLARNYLNLDNPILIANCDQYLEWNFDDFIKFANENDIDGLISTFKNNDFSTPKWSYVSLNADKYIQTVAEKEAISNYACTGIYYWKKSSDYIKYAEQMIYKNIRINNEFYVSNVYNEAIDDGKKFKILECTKFWGLGTPEDLNYFINNYISDEIIIGIFACPTVIKYKTEIDIINESWGKTCDKYNIKYFFFLGEQRTKLKGDKYIYLKGVQNDYHSASDKHWLGYKYIYDNYPNTKFIFMIGSDTFVDVKKLRNECIVKYNYNDEIIITAVRSEVYDRTINDKKRIRFVDGGTGYIITKATIHKLAKAYDFTTLYAEWTNFCYEFRYCVDVAMGYYCIENNITVMEDSKFFNRLNVNYSNPNDFYSVHPNNFYQLYTLSLAYSSDT